MKKIIIIMICLFSLGQSGYAWPFSSSSQKASTYFIKSLKKLDEVKKESYERIMNDYAHPDTVIKEGLQEVMVNAEKSYQEVLKYYKGQMIKFSEKKKISDDPDEIEVKMKEKYQSYELLEPFLEGCEQIKRDYADLVVDRNFTTKEQAQQKEQAIIDKAVANFLESVERTLKDHIKKISDF